MPDSYIITRQGKIIRTPRKNRFTTELLILGESTWQKQAGSKTYNCRCILDLKDSEAT